MSHVGMTIRFSLIDEKKRLSGLAVTGEISDAINAFVISQFVESILLNMSLKKKKKKKIEEDGELNHRHACLIRVVSTVSNPTNEYPSSFVDWVVRRVSAMLVSLWLAIESMQCS